MSSEDEAKERNRKYHREYKRKWRQLNRDKLAESQRQYREANREKSIEATRRWREANQEQVAGYQRRYNESNREKKAESARRWAEVNPERHAEAGSRWRKENPEKRVAAERLRRARKIGSGGSHTEAEWQALCSYYMDQCLCCGEVPDQLTRDHIVPLIKGGSDDISNIQPLCGSCNSRKNARTIDYRLSEMVKGQ